MINMEDVLLQYQKGYKTIKEFNIKKIIQNNEYDAHGNIQLSGSGALGDYLSNILKTKLKIKRVELIH